MLDTLILISSSENGKEQDFIIPLRDIEMAHFSGRLYCKVNEADLTRAVLSQFPGLMDMLEFAAGKVETAASAVEKEIAEYETRIAKTFDGLRIVNDEYRALTDSRDRLTQASAKHARTLGEYRRLKAIMDNKQDVCDTSSTEAQ